MNRLWTVILNLFFWGPPIVMAIYCGNIIVGILITAGEFVVVVVACMILEWINDDEY